MHHYVYFKFFILMLVLSSCSLSLSKKEKCQNVISNPSIEKTMDQTLCSSVFKKGKWPPKKWWRQYKSPELNCLIEEALKQNPSIQAISERVDWAKKEAEISRSNLYPFVFFNASDSWQYLSENGVYRALNPKISLNAHDIDLSMGFNYEFDFWGKYRNLYQAAIGKEKAVIAEEAQVKLILSTGFAQAYFACKTNLIRQKLYHRFYSLRKKIFILQKKMLKNALYSKLPPLLSEEELFKAKQWVLDIDQKVIVGKHLINFLAGRGPDAPLHLIAPLSDFPDTLAIPTDISTELISRRPDLQVQIWRLDSMAHEVGAAKADFFPNINLSGLVGLEGFSWSNVFEWVSKTIGLFPGLKLPVYTAGRISANIQGKKALFNEAVFEYNNLILKSFKQVTDLLAVGKAIYEEKNKQNQIVKNAKERYELTLLLQKNGIDSAFKSYKNLEEEILAEIDDVKLFYEQYAISISLIKALGGGYTCPEKK